MFRRKESSPAILKTAKWVVSKLLPLSAAALFVTAAHADICPDPKVIMANYVTQEGSNDGFNETTKESGWKLSWNKDTTTPTDFRGKADRIKLISIRTQLLALDKKEIDVLSCTYADPGAKQKTLTLSFGNDGKRTVQGKLTFNEGWQLVINGGYGKGKIERINHAKWKEMDIGSEPGLLTRTCTELDTSGTDPSYWCGGITFTETKHTPTPEDKEDAKNGFWETAGANCNMKKELCKEYSPVSYVHKIELLNNALDEKGTIYRYCIQREGSGNRCAKDANGKEMIKEVQRSLYCKDLKCTAEIKAMNELIHGTGSRAQIGNEGMARSLELCWKDANWQYKLWDKKDGKNCTARTATESWPDYNKVFDQYGIPY